MKLNINITKVISYKNAWPTLQSEHNEEYQDILNSLPHFVEEFISTKNKPFKYDASREIWNHLLSMKNWEVLARVFRSAGGHSIPISSLGPVKNSVSAFVSISHFEILNRWLFQQTVIAYKYDIAKIPILLVPTNEFAIKLEERFANRATFEAHLRQIQPLVPLSHGYPFLILGFSDSEKDEMEIHEIESDLLSENGEIIIDRCIEFSPEFQQAGVGILSYFSTYLNEQYPNEKAKVKIEQNGQIVRLTIETHTGEKEIIEKALSDYQLVVTGKVKVEEITHNQKLILELNSELRIAKYRIETQQDLIQVQGGQIDKLLTIIGDGLTSKNQVYLDFKPQITLNNSTIINNNISEAVTSIHDLKSLIPTANPEYIILEDLQLALESIEPEKNPEMVKKSPAISKLKKFIEDVSSGNDKLAKTIKAAENGYEMIQNLAGKYNKIAEWCGLPQVPKVYTK